MKKDRDLYFENQGYFTNPMMGQPGYQTSQMYMNNGFGQMPYMNMGMAFPNAMNYNYPNQNNFNNYDTNSIEQRLYRMERQIKRLDARVSRIEAKSNMDETNYKTTSDNYQINETNMYMM